MDYSERWRIIEGLGEGGQGKVYRVCSLNPALEGRFLKSLGYLTATISPVGEREKHLHEFMKGLGELLRAEEPANHGALKVLHEPKDARDADLARTRIKREIKAMSENIHPNLIRILDFDPDSAWYVSKFYQNGTLADNKDMFKGNFAKALEAIRPLVEAVATLHKKGYVHRDIKPQNVFLNSNNDLVLGDFGLIYFEDDLRTRISPKYENVGSRDWMPPWAMGMRIDELKPTFDVFSLGKLLWYMVSGKSVLRLWYFDRNTFNVERLFPESPTIEFANPFFKKCIVENEKDCMKNATMLLSEIDEILKKIKVHVKQIESAQKAKSIRDIQEKMRWSTLPAFKTYVLQAMAAIVIFVALTLVAIAMHWFGERLNLQGAVIVFRMIESTIFVLGGLLCVTLVLRITIQFMRFLIKGPPQATSE